MQLNFCCKQRSHQIFSRFGPKPVVWHHHNIHSVKALFDSCVLQMNTAIIQSNYTCVFTARCLKEESQSCDFVNLSRFPQKKHKNLQPNQSFLAKRNPETTDFIMFIFFFISIYLCGHIHNMYLRMHQVLQTKAPTKVWRHITKTRIHKHSAVYQREGRKITKHPLTYITFYGK